MAMTSVCIYAARATGWPTLFGLYEFEPLIANTSRIQSQDATHASRSSNQASMKQSYQTPKKLSQKNATDGCIAEPPNKHQVSDSNSCCLQKSLEAQPLSRALCIEALSPGVLNPRPRVKAKFVTRQLKGQVQLATSRLASVNMFPTRHYTILLGRGRSFFLMLATILVSYLHPFLGSFLNKEINYNFNSKLE